jgi:hypothetical protein
MKPPLILTIKIDESSFNYFNGLRKNHFPPERNFIEAHLSLFHALPNEKSIIETIKNMAAKYSEFEMMVQSAKSIGNGVAFPLVSDDLTSLHRQLQVLFHGFLTPQDSQKIWPHITVQNKVPADKAKALFDDLQDSFVSFSATALGLQVWEYLGGPWKEVDEFLFPY